MSQQPQPLAKQPVLKPAADYYLLRRDGIGLIEKLSGSLWTDYNTHDPGITILEALCYASTELAYRTSWDILDILTPATLPPAKKPPFPDQPFFPARQILTINPWTPADFRRLLIDLPAIRNAWVICKECACDVLYYAWCEENQLRLGYQKPVEPATVHPVVVKPRGEYEILLELEPDAEGDLNERKLEHSYTIFDSDGNPHQVLLELRFPEWGLAKWDAWKLFLESKESSAAFVGKDLTVLKFSRSKTFNGFLSDAELRQNWRNVFYSDFELELLPSGQKLRIENAALRVSGDTFVKSQTTVSGLKDLLGDKSPHGFIQRYRNRLLKATEAVKAAKEALWAHRNLDEDYCRIKVIAIEEVAVCADVEVMPDADIERVQAEIWFRIERYFNPAVPFYTLRELMDAGTPVEEIFNGPEMTSGFIKSEDLEAAGLKTVLRTSDIINLLMDIPGVIAVNNLLLSKYDGEGNIVKGSADPSWDKGKPLFDADKSSASWLLFVSPMHQPRLYVNLSRFLFYKNGLPFKPRLDEANDTLTQLRGEDERPKISSTPLDLPVNPGVFRSPEDYWPVQYSFPMTYGIGRDGLPAGAPKKRRAQAKQLKAYLMVFEQLLGNATTQLAHTADLFSLNPDVKQTYFARQFTHDLILDYELITTQPNLAELQAIIETRSEFLQRRNRFLNHIMARFGEQFDEYALLLTSLLEEPVALDSLIEDRTAFVKAYPAISHDRAKAFNYSKPCAPDNIAGLKKRISLLLGYPDLGFTLNAQEQAPGKYSVTFELKDPNQTSRFEGNLVVTAEDEDTAKVTAFRQIMVQMIQPNAYEVVPESGKFRLQLKAKGGGFLGKRAALFNSKAEAEAFRDEVLTWSANERGIIVEHLLLRPKFPGDALYPACTEGVCETCGDQDPYSFRLTFVMAGWTGPFNGNLDLRAFAERTIQRETPAHLLGKTCWVANDGFIENPCEPVVDELAALLEAEGLTAGGDRPSGADACACALAIYRAFSKVFDDWYEDKVLDYVHEEALKSRLEQEFNSKVDLSAIACTTVLTPALSAQIQAMMVQHFQQVAINGWQFERFEDAWYTWCGANAKIDWAEERLQERVEAILSSNLINGPAASEEGLCKCAAAILTRYGMSFFDWLESNLKAGKPLKDLTNFTPEPVTLCAGFTFKPGTKESIESLLKSRYADYKEVSYFLWVVVKLLSTLRNTYPEATLHDCDDGSDHNPVRLGATALGNLPQTA